MNSKLINFKNLILVFLLAPVLCLVVAEELSAKNRKRQSSGGKAKSQKFAEDVDARRDKSEVKSQVSSQVDKDTDEDSEDDEDDYVKVKVPSRLQSYFLKVDSEIFALKKKSVKIPFSDMQYSRIELVAENGQVLYDNEHRLENFSLRKLRLQRFNPYFVLGKANYYKDYPQGIFNPGVYSPGGIGFNYRGDHWSFMVEGTDGNSTGRSANGLVSTVSIRRLRTFIGKEFTLGNRYSRFMNHICITPLLGIGYSDIDLSLEDEHVEIKDSYKTAHATAGGEINIVLKNGISGFYRNLMTYEKMKFEKISFEGEFILNEQYFGVSYGF